jgi:anaerobic ribonucleoside-triphosphate reductase activating protein
VPTRLTAGPDVLEITACITPDSWDPAGGSLVPVDHLADALLDPQYERDGISILGGEPFFQPGGLASLVDSLRKRGCRHIVVYSGYTHAQLCRMAQGESAIGVVLSHIDLLIDGPYVAAQAASAGPWTGSGNQRVIDLAAVHARCVETSAAMHGGCSQEERRDR